MPDNAFIIDQPRADLTITMSVTRESLDRKKSECYRAAATCRRNGKYEMCAFWLSICKRLCIKYGC